MLMLVFAACHPIIVEDIVEVILMPRSPLRILGSRMSHVQVGRFPLIDLML